MGFPREDGVHDLLELNDIKDFKKGRRILLSSWIAAEIRFTIEAMPNQL